MHILLVEDNPADVELVQEAFREWAFPYCLDVAEDGVAAMQFLRGEGRFATAKRPDIVLLDLNLPKKDGREVLQEMKGDSLLQTIPVIVLTTSDDEGDVLRAYGLHANCYLTKPVELDSFIHKIRSIENFWLTVVRLPCSDSKVAARTSRPL